LVTRGGTVGRAGWQKYLKEPNEEGGGENESEQRFLGQMSVRRQNATSTISGGETVSKEGAIFKTWRLESAGRKGATGWGVFSEIIRGD